MRTGRSYIRSSSFIMALLFTVLCGAAALTLGYYIDYFARGHFSQSTVAVIDSEIRYIETLVDKSLLPNIPGRLFVSVDENGTFPGNLSQDVPIRQEGILVFERPEDGRKYASKIHKFKDGQSILIGTDITDISRDFKFMQIMGIASIVFVMIVVFVSYLISVFVVSGTNKIANTARDIIDTGDLTRRIDIGSSWDDLGNMTTVLNTLFQRIEELMAGVKQVSDNIAHDLRTPLTRLRQKIETLPAEQGEGLLKEADHLLLTFNALLRISRIEAERQRSRFQPLQVDQVLMDVIEFYEPWAEERQITFKARLEKSDISGDRDLLFQAFANIFDNALKFSPLGGIVDISLTKQGNKTIVTIDDNGPGVPDKELNRIFERFYRAEASRHTTGTGLGLSLVAAVISLHNGQISAQKTSSGFRIITIL